MPRDYGKISISIWRSRKFISVRKDDAARLFYFYLHTCPQTNSCGCFHLPIGYAATDLGWTFKAVAEAIERLSKAFLIDWNRAEEVVRIVNFLEHDPPTNPNHARSMAKIAIELPDCEQKAIIISELVKFDHSKEAKNFKELKAEFERLSKAFPKPIETPLPLSPVPDPLPKPTYNNSTREVVDFVEETEDTPLEPPRPGPRRSAAQSRLITGLEDDQPRTRRSAREILEEAARKKNGA